MAAPRERDYADLHDPPICGCRELMKLVDLRMARYPFFVATAHWRCTHCRSELQFFSRVPADA